MSRPVKRNKAKASPKSQGGGAVKKRPFWKRVLKELLKWAIALFVLAGVMAYGTHLLAASGAIDAKALDSTFACWLTLLTIAFVIFCHGGIIARSIGVLTGGASSALQQVERSCLAIAKWFESFIH